MLVSVDVWNLRVDFFLEFLNFRKKSIVSIEERLCCRKLRSVIWRSSMECRETIRFRTNKIFIKFVLCFFRPVFVYCYYNVFVNNLFSVFCQHSTEPFNSNLSTHFSFRERMLKETFRNVHVPSDIYLNFSPTTMFNW